MKGSVMIDISKIDYSLFDNPKITRVLFYPRQEFGRTTPHTGADSILIPVEKDVVVGARFYSAGEDVPTILFFHGNGEIVDDYSDMGTIYTDMGVNFLPVDYRGYGLSTGYPTVSAMMRDCHVIFDFVRNWLAERKCTGPFIVMGRSLGSVSALELAFHYKGLIDGLIIESGLAYTRPLLRLMGISLDNLGITEDQGFRNIEKIKQYDGPTLVIHAEYDHIISFEEGLSLFEASPSPEKKLLKIPGANHNDIFFRGMSAYLDSIKWLVDIIISGGPK